MIGRGSAEMHMGESAELTGDDARPVVLEASGLSDGAMIRDISLTLRSGEITGVYGFMGCGQIELARALFGKGGLRGGQLTLDGKPVQFRSTAAARRAGIAYPAGEPAHDAVPHRAGVQEHLDRHSRPHPPHSAASRAASARSPMRTSRTCRSARRSPDIALGNLSGGNQQKVALAKWLTHLPKVLILSEPTRGMDVGAKEDVIRIVKSLRDRGVAVLVLSTEPETILTLADRVTVLKRGVGGARIHRTGISRRRTCSMRRDHGGTGSRGSDGDDR